MKYQNRNVLITGAASGIGRAAAQAFIKEGANLALIDRNQTALEALASELKTPDQQVLTFACDLKDTQALHAMFDNLLDQWPHIDVACNNAGISGFPTPFWDVDEQVVDDILAINVKSVWLCMQRELKSMMKQGRGAIVNTASVAGLKGFPQYAAYAASKHAVIGLTKSVAFEVASQGIRINAVCPGMTETPMVTQIATPEIQKKILKTIPMGRLGQPHEIAQLMLFLCSEDASFTTGQSYVASGGAYT